MEYVKVFLDIFRTHNILLYVACITTGVLSYNVLGVAELAGYTEIQSGYKNYTSFIFLVSLITIIVLSARSIVVGIKNYWIANASGAEVQQQIEAKIINLSNKEKAVLLQFYIQQSETIWLPFRGQEVVEFINAGVLILASNAARNTRAGEAALLKLSSNSRSLLAKYHSNIFTADYDRELVDNLIRNHTPESVHTVNESRRLFGF